MQERSGDQVWNFRMAINTRTGKRATEATVSCWRDLGRFFAQYLTVGDRVVVTGCLGHMAGHGVVVTASSLARLGEEMSASTEQRRRDAAMQIEEEPNELTWSNYLDRMGPGVKR